MFVSLNIVIFHKRMINSGESVADVNNPSPSSVAASHSEPQQRLVDDNDVCSHDESATSETQTYQVDPHQPAAPQPPLYPSVVSQTDAVVCDTTADMHLVQEDDSDVPSIEATFDDSEYHDCINASLAGNLFYWCFAGFRLYI